MALGDMSVKSAETAQIQQQKDMVQPYLNRIVKEYRDSTNPPALADHTQGLTEAIDSFTMVAEWKKARMPAPAPVVQPASGGGGQTAEPRATTEMRKRLAGGKGNVFTIDDVTCLCAAGKTDSTVLDKMQDMNDAEFRALGSSKNVFSTKMCLTPTSIPLSISRSD